MESRPTLRRLATFHTARPSGRLASTKELEQQWVTTDEGKVRLRRSRSLGGVEQESWHIMPASALETKLDPIAEAKLNKKRSYNKKSTLIGARSSASTSEPSLSPEFEEFLREKREELRQRKSSTSSTTGTPSPRGSPLSESNKPRPPTTKKPQRTTVRIQLEASGSTLCNSGSSSPSSSSRPVVPTVTLSEAPVVPDTLRRSSARNEPPSPRRAAAQMEDRIALLTREGIEIAMVDGSPVIRAGLLERVVHRCAVYLSSSVELQTVQNQIIALFIALPRFCTPIEMVELLEKIYQEPVSVPAGASAETQLKFNCRSKLGVLRLFVMWMDHDSQAVANNMPFQHRAITFLTSLGENDFPPKEREELIRLRDSVRTRFMEANRAANAAKASLPPPRPIGLFTRKLVLGSFEFADLNPRDVADSLTVLDKRALSSITRREILTQKWEGVQEAFSRAGKLAKWVATEVVLFACCYYLFCLTFH